MLAEMRQNTKNRPNDRCCCRFLLQVEWLGLVVFEYYEYRNVSMFQGNRCDWKSLFVEYILEYLGDRGAGTVLRTLILAVMPPADRGL